MAAILNTKRKAPLFHPLLYFKPTNLFLEIRHFDWPQLSVSFNVQDASSLTMQNRAVIKSRGPGIFPSYYKCGPRLLSLGNRRKRDSNEIPRCLIPRLLVVFTRQIEILVTNPAKYACFAGYLAINM